MKFEIKPIDIKEKVITIETFIDPEEVIPEDFKDTVKECDFDTKEFTKNNIEELFDFLYEKNETLLAYHTPNNQIEHTFKLCFNVKSEEIVKETITPEIISSYAFQNDLKVYNHEILKQLKKELKIAKINPLEYNISFNEKQKYDVYVYRVESSHATCTYAVIHRKSKGLTLSMLALLCDDNLCFGFRRGTNIGYPCKNDFGENFSYQEIIIQTD